MTPKKWRITSLETVWYEGWYIKPSVSTLDSFCVVMYNERTDESVIGFATDEMEANRFIECVVESGKSLES